MTTKTELIKELPKSSIIKPFKKDKYNIDVIFNEEDLIEFAEGKISNVFGEYFSIIDSYKNRVLLPMKEYLLVSRVTKLNASIKKEFNQFSPGTITT